MASGSVTRRSRLDWAMVPTLDYSGVNSKGNEAKALSGVVAALCAREAAWCRAVIVLGLVVRGWDFGAG